MVFLLFYPHYCKFMSGLVLGWPLCTLPENWEEPTAVVSNSQVPWPTRTICNHNLIVIFSFDYIPCFCLWVFVRHYVCQGLENMSCFAVLSCIFSPPARWGLLDFNIALRAFFLLFSSSPSRLLASSPAPDRSGRCWTSIASARSQWASTTVSRYHSWVQWAPLDLNRGLPVGTAGPQPGDLPSPVGIAGPQPGTSRAQWALLDLNRQIDCQIECPIDWIECQITCQNRCQIECQIEGQIESQIECQHICQIKC